MPMKIEVCKVCHKPAGPVLYSTTVTGDCTAYELHCEACGSVWEGYEELTVYTQAEYDEAVKAAKIAEGQRIVNKLRRRIYKWAGSEKGIVNHKPVYIPAPKVLEWTIKELENG